MPQTQTTIDTNIHDQISILFEKHFSSNIEYECIEGKATSCRKKVSFQGFNSCLNALFLDQAFQELLFNPENKVYWERAYEKKYEVKNTLVGTSNTIKYGIDLIHSLHKCVTQHTLSVPLNKAYAKALDVDTSAAEIKSRLNTYEQFIKDFPKDGKSASETFSEDQIESYITRFYALKTFYDDYLCCSGEDFSGRCYNDLDFSKQEAIALFFSGTFMHDLFDVFHLGQTLGYNSQIEIKPVITQLKENLKSSDEELKKTSLQAFEIIFHCIKNVENRVLSSEDVDLSHDYFCKIKGMVPQTVDEYESVEDVDQQVNLKMLHSRDEKNEEEISLKMQQFWLVGAFVGVGVGLLATYAGMPILIGIGSLAPTTANMLVFAVVFALFGALLDVFFGSHKQKDQEPEDLIKSSLDSNQMKQHDGHAKSPLLRLDIDESKEATLEMKRSTLNINNPTRSGGLFPI